MLPLSADVSNQKCKNRGTRRPCPAVFGIVRFESWEKDGLQSCAVFPGGLRIPARTVFYNSPLRWIVDVNKAEALGVAAVPLEIIGQRPVEKAADIGSLGTFLQRKKVPVQKIDAVGVVDLPI